MEQIWVSDYLYTGSYVTAPRGRWEVLALAKGGDPATDVSRFTKLYVRFGDALRKANKLCATGMYECIVIRREQIARIGLEKVPNRTLQREV